MRSSVPTLTTVALAMLFSLLLVCPAAVPAQGTASSEAPVVWERYKASTRKESVLLPKLPTAKEQTFWCSELRMDSYYAYAEDAVYEFSVARKGSLGDYSNCTPKRFNQTMFEDRLKELRDEKLRNTESTASKNGLDGYEFAYDTSSRWVFPDLKNRRWIELAVHHRPGVKVDDAKFTGSLDLSSNEGKDIGSGSPVTLGDAGVGSSVMSPLEKKQDPKDPNAEPFRIISKPRPAYTDQARRDNVQGRVTLRVVFLASGGIGSVTVVNALKDGLTEQAIAAAKRIVFLPKKVNGIPVSTTTTFEYGFNIY
jgi:TonB family protein